MSKANAQHKKVHDYKKIMRKGMNERVHQEKKKTFFGRGHKVAGTR